MSIDEIDDESDGGEDEGEESEPGGYGVEDGEAFDCGCYVEERANHEGAADGPDDKDWNDRWFVAEDDGRWHCPFLQY